MRKNGNMNSLLRAFDKIERKLWGFILRIFQAFIAIGLWVLWVNYEPVLKELALAFGTMPFQEFRESLGWTGLLVVAYALFTLEFMRFALKTVAEQINSLKGVKDKLQKVPLKLKSTNRIMR